MTEPNDQPLTDNQNEKIIDSLRVEIASLKSLMKKKDDRIASLDVMLNTLMESHNAEVRAYEDLKDKLVSRIMIFHPFREGWDHLISPPGSR
jgi:hypothetical protein